MATACEEPREKDLKGSVELKKSFQQAAEAAEGAVRVPNGDAAWAIPCPEMFPEQVAQVARDASNS